MVHDAKVHGDKALKIIGIYIVDKTKTAGDPRALKPDSAYYPPRTRLD